MPVHDWKAVEAGIFHAFHGGWIAELSKRLNGGLLPKGYYALAEQHTGYSIADVLTLASGTEERGRPVSDNPKYKSNGVGTAIADAPPRVRRREKVQSSYTARRRSLAIRHVSGHHLVALLEILSPGNKDGVMSLNAFESKAIEALRAGVHLLLADLFPPEKYDPQGIHGVIRERLECDEAYDLPAGEPLTLAAYAAGIEEIEMYIEHLAVGTTLPDMPLFLQQDRYINVPLEDTYMEAYRGMPTYWRDVLEGRQPSDSTT